MKLKDILNEISVKAGLKDVSSGRTTAIEGVKMTDEMANHIQYWINTSPFGRKYGKQIEKGRIHSLLPILNSQGFADRTLKSSRLKKEWKVIAAKHINPTKREDVNEATDTPIKNPKDIKKVKKGQMVWADLSGYIKLGPNKWEDRATGTKHNDLEVMGHVYKAKDKFIREAKLNEAPKMRKDPYVEKLRLLYKEIAKLDNQMKAADSSRYSHVKKDFNKALKAVAELTNTLNRKGATIPGA
jgi:hypothetical protein